MAGCVELDGSSLLIFGFSVSSVPFMRYRLARLFFLQYLFVKKKTSVCKKTSHTFHRPGLIINPNGPIWTSNERVWSPLSKTLKKVTHCQY